MRRYRRRSWKAWISTCLILGATFLPYLTGPIVAQTTTGGLRGVVMDVTGAVVPGATVVAKNVATGVEHRTTATSEGVYTISRIPPGK